MNDPQTPTDPPKEPAVPPAPKSANDQAVPPALSTPQPVELSASEIQSKKLASGLMGILIGGLGIHKFYLGYQQEGIIMILVTLVGGGVGTMLTCGLLAPVLVIMPIIGMIEGIIYLTKTDQDFAEIYLKGRRPWF